MEQPKISKELLREVYGNRKIEWEDHVMHIGPCFSIRRPGNLGRGMKDFKNINEIVHDIKVYISKNFEKYGMDIVQDYHHVEVMKASAMIKEFWDDEDETYYNPQRVFEAFEWIIENCEKETK